MISQKKSIPGRWNNRAGKHSNEQAVGQQRARAMGALGEPVWGLLHRVQI